MIDIAEKANLKVKVSSYPSSTYSTVSGSDGYMPCSRNITFFFSAIVFLACPVPRSGLRGVFPLQYTAPTRCLHHLVMTLGAVTFTSQLVGGRDTAVVKAGNEERFRHLGFQARKRVNNRDYDGASKVLKEQLLVALPGQQEHLVHRALASVYRLAAAQIDLKPLGGGHKSSNLTNYHRLQWKHLQRALDIQPDSKSVMSKLGLLEKECLVHYVMARLGGCATVFDPQNSPDLQPTYITDTIASIDLSANGQISHESANSIPADAFGGNESVGSFLVHFTSMAVKSAPHSRAATIAHTNAAAAYLEIANKQLQGNNEPAQTDLHFMKGLVDQAARHLNLSMASFNVSQSATCIPGEKGPPHFTAICKNTRVVGDFYSHIQKYLDAIAVVPPAGEKQSSLADHKFEQPSFRESVKYPQIERKSWNEVKSAHPEIALASFLRHRREPIILENTTVNAWKYRHTLGNSSYLEQHLPDKLYVELTPTPQSRFSSGVLKIPNMHKFEFFSRLDQMQAGKEASSIAAYPYFSITLSHVVKDLRHQPWVEQLLSDYQQVDLTDTVLGLDNLGNGPIITLWVGAPNVTASAHFDTSMNVLVMLQGRKHVIMAPPQDAPHLYLHPHSSNSHRQSLIEDFRRIDPKIFPEAEKASFQQGAVSAGDLLYIPPMWLHSFRSLDEAISLTIWSLPADIDAAVRGMLEDFCPGLQHIAKKLFDDMLPRNLAKELYTVMATEVALGTISATYKTIRERTSFIESIIRTSFEKAQQDPGRGLCRVDATCPSTTVWSGLPVVIHEEVGRCLEQRVVYLKRLAAASQGMDILVLRWSTIFLSHIAVAGHPNINLGDEASDKVCSFMKSCLQPHLGI